MVKLAFVVRPRFGSLNEWFPKWWSFMPFGKEETITTEISAEQAAFLESDPEVRRLVKRTFEAAAGLTVTGMYATVTHTETVTFFPEDSNV